MPQRSPGLAGGPLSGPVGEFNGFTPTRQQPAANLAAPAGSDLPRRLDAGDRSPLDPAARDPLDPAAARDPFGASAARDPFGAPADRPSFGVPAGQPPLGTGPDRPPFGAAANRPPYGSPADGARDPFASSAAQGSASPADPFGAAPADGAEQPTGRAPGVSAFGDQRIRVPGATLTDLPDGPPSGGFPLRSGTGGGSFPLRGASSAPAQDETEGGAFRRNGDLPARDSAGGAFGTPRSSDSGAFGTARESESGAFPAARGPESEAFPAARGSESGTFAAGDDARGGTFGARDAAASSPFDKPERGSSAGDPFGRAEGGEANDPFGRGNETNSPFGASGRAENGAGDPFGRGNEANSPFAAPSRAEGEANDPFGRGNEANSPFAAPGRAEDAGDGSGRGDAGDPFGARGSSPSGGFAARSASADQPGPDGFRVASGESPAVPPRRPFDEEQEPAQDGSSWSGSGGYAQRVPGASFAASGSPDAHQDAGNSGGYPQRIPGASLGTASGPAASVPQPRDPFDGPEAAERPGAAKGTARPVSASASVPVASRVTPVDADEVPPQPAAPQSRVYGRPAQQPDEAPEQPFAGESQPVSGGFGAAPTSGAQSGGSTPGTYGRPAESNTYGSPAVPESFEGGFGTAPTSGDAPAPGRMSGRASASARVSPPAGQPFAPASPAPGAEAGPVDFSEFTTDVAGRGRPGHPGPVPGNPASRTTPPDQYAEHTTDVAGRGQAPEQPYVPAPALPAMHAAPPLENGFPPAPEATQPFDRRSPDGGHPFDRRSPDGGHPFDQRSPDGALPFGQQRTPDATQPFGEQPMDSPHPFGERPGDSPHPFGERPGDSPHPFGERPGDSAPPFGERHPDATQPFGERHADATQPFPGDSAPPYGERPKMGGVFPGPASRATVTPPGPDQTASWPSRNEPEVAEQGRFDSFRPEEPVKAPEAAKPDTPHVRMLPVILGVILGAGLLVGLTLGITWLIARGSNDGGAAGFSVSTGDCVKRNGEEAVTASCSDAGAFEVTAIVDAKEKCPDAGQPYVLNPTSDGKTQVLCLKPRT